MPQHPKALLFDLGGVLIDIDFGRAISAWSRYSSLSITELKQRFHFDAEYESHERGELASESYFTHIASSLQLSATPAQVEVGWNSIFVAEIARTRVLVQNASKRLTCYAFTNTNASHMARWSKLFPQVVSVFSQVFASHQIGMRKPDARAFAYICNAVGLNASDIAFYDDLPENVSAAAASGLMATVVRTPSDVEASLQHYGLLSEA